METAIEIKSSNSGNIQIFSFHGELDETNADKTFNDIYSQIGDFSAETKIIFQLDGLKYLNSKSIGYIADIYSNIEDNGGVMAISDCSEGVKDILELVGITTIISTYDTLDAALAELG